MHNNYYFFLQFYNPRKAPNSEVSEPGVITSPDEIETSHDEIMLVEQEVPIAPTHVDSTTTINQDHNSPRDATSAEQLLRNASTEAGTIPTPNAAQQQFVARLKPELLLDSTTSEATAALGREASPVVASTIPSSQELPGATNLSAMVSSTDESEGFAAQLSSFGDPDTAREALGQFFALSPDLTIGFDLFIKETNSGAAGSHHQLRVGGFATANEAEAYCNQWRARGQDCLVVTR